MIEHTQPVETCKACLEDQAYADEITQGGDPFRFAFVVDLDNRADQVEDAAAR
jgi:hypothetical protein